MPIDTLTRNVLRSLWWPVVETEDFRSRPTYWKIANRLGVSPKTVRSKLESLQKDGVVARVAVRPDVSLFGLRKSGIIIALHNKTRVAFEEKLRFLDYVECVHMARVYLMEDGRLKVPPDASSGFTAEVDVIHEPGEGLERKVDLLRSLCGDFAVIHTVSFGANSHPEPFRKMLLLLRELSSRPFADVGELARASGIYEGTAAKYLEELARTRAFIFEPVLDTRRSSLVFFHIGLVVEPENRSRLAARMKERLSDNWLGTNNAGDLIGVVCAASNLAEINDLYFRLKQEDELEGSFFLLGVYTIDNQANVRYLRVK